MQKIDKDTVRKRFTKAISTYDSNASVQAAVAERLADTIGMAVCSSGMQHADHIGRVLEIGCGTGLFTREFLKRFRPCRMFLNDICPGHSEFIASLLAESGPHGTRTDEPSPECMFSFIGGDAEGIAYPDRLDLIASCSAIQWFEDLPTFFARCSEALHAGGILAIATYGPGNLSEIREIENISLEYPPMKELGEMLSAHFRIVSLQEMHISLDFSSPMDVLRHMKLTGVTGTGHDVWTKGRCSRFCEEYSARFTDGNGMVRLTYHPILAVAVKD